MYISLREKLTNKQCTDFSQHPVSWRGDFFHLPCPERTVVICGHTCDSNGRKRTNIQTYQCFYIYIYLYIYSTIQPDFSAAISSGDAKQHPLGRVDSHKGPHGEAAIRATRKQGAGVCCAGWAAGKQLGNGLETMKEGDLDLLKAWKHHIYIYLGHIRNKQLDPAKWTAQQNVLQQWFQPRSERES